MNVLKKVVSKHSRRSSAASSDRDDAVGSGGRSSLDQTRSPLAAGSPRVQETTPRLPTQPTASGPTPDHQRDLGRLNLNQDDDEHRRAPAATSTLPRHEHQHEQEHSKGLGSKLSSAILDHPDTVQDHQTLAPVVHNRIHHHETEIVTRHREVERHIHHVQHHIQPLIEEVHTEERHYQQSHPLTEEYEEKANTPEDKAFFALLNKQKFTETHICEERIVIDNGEKVRQTIHYHVHNVVQPVIYRDRPIPSACVPASAALSSTRHSLAPAPATTAHSEPLAASSSRAGAATLNVKGDAAPSSASKLGGMGQGATVGQGQTTALQPGLAR